MAEFVFDFVDVKEFVREGDRDYFKQVSAPQCDFCSDVRVRWEYDCGEFVVPELEWGSDDQWVACDRCSALIEAGDREGVKARMVRSRDVRGMGEEDIPVWSVELIQNGFFDNRFGERRAFG